MSGGKADKKCEKKEQERISKLTDEERRLEYREKGIAAWDRAWEILNTEDGWTDAAGTDLHTGKVCYQKFSDIGRVFKLQGIVPLNPEKLFEEVVTNVEQNPIWNPTVLGSKIVEKVDADKDICHNIAATAAGGLVASRDFVSVRHWKTKNGIILSAGVSVPHPDVPPSKEYVRGYNKPGGWFFAPYEPDPKQGIFGWLMATDLRGWLPHSVIEQVLPRTQLDFLRYLRKHVQNGLKATHDDQGAS